MIKTDGIKFQLTEKGLFSLTNFCFQKIEEKKKNKTRTLEDKQIAGE